MADKEVPYCPRCGHRYYNDAPTSSGVCKYCASEPVELCYICGKEARCTGMIGERLCLSPECERQDYFAWNRKYDEENPDPLYGNYEY